MRRNKAQHDHKKHARVNKKTQSRSAGVPKPENDATKTHTQKPCPQTGKIEDPNPMVFGLQRYGVRIFLCVCVCVCVCFLLCVIFGFLKPQFL